MRVPCEGFSAAQIPKRHHRGRAEIALAQKILATPARISGPHTTWPTGGCRSTKRTSAITIPSDEPTSHTDYAIAGAQVARGVHAARSALSEPELEFIADFRNGPYSTPAVPYRILMVGPLYPSPFP